MRVSEIVKILSPEWGTSIGYRPVGMTLALSLTLTFMSKSMLVGVPVLLKFLLDSLRPGKLTPLLVIFIIAYSLCRFLSEFFQELKNWLVVPIMAKCAQSLTLAAHDHLFRLPLNFHLNRKSGALIRILDRGGDAIHTLMSQVVFHVLPKIVELSLTVGLLFWGYGYFLPEILILTISAYVFVTFQLTKTRIVIKAEMDANKSSISSIIAESANNFEIIKSLRTESARSAVLGKALTLAEDHLVSWERNLVRINVAQASIILVGIFATLLYTAWHVTCGKYSVGDFVLINSLVIQITMQLGNAASMYRNITDSVADIRAVLELISIDGETRTACDCNVPLESHSVRFADVSFSYPGAKRTLDSISLFVESGTRLAIVGPTGSGKTTLIRMLTGLISPDSGLLKIGNREIQTFSSETLGRVISVVPQDVTLFDGTIATNIVAGISSVDDKLLTYAVEAARLQPLIERLPEGLHTQIGERGLKLSGGERQRIALARALVRKTPIVVLDEATSALDTKTEQEIKLALTRVRGVTLIVIAHRLSSIAEFDQIVVLDCGRIVESGTHERLLASGGLYKSMWERKISEEDNRPDITKSAEGAHNIDAVIN